MMLTVVMQILGRVQQSCAQSIAARFYFDESLTWEY